MDPILTLALILNEIPKAEYLITREYNYKCREEINTYDSFYLRTAVDIVAIKMELLDARSTGKYEEWDFAQTIEAYQRNYFKTKGYPKIEDINLFPPSEYCSIILFTTRKHIEFLQNLREIVWYKEELSEEIRICWRICEVYESIKMAKDLNRDIISRREALQDIKTLIGTENYIRGQLPLP